MFVSKNVLFSLFLCYFWALQYLPVEGEIERFSVLYFLLVGSAIAFAMSFSLFVSYGQRKVRSEVWVLIFFLAPVVVIAGARRDLQTIQAVGLFTVVMIAILQKRLRVSITQLNYLTLLSIPASMVMFHAGFSMYGYIPGMSHAGEGEAWRIALGSSAPVSGFLCATVILANQLNTSARFRTLTRLVAWYYLLFSGVRSALIAVFLGLFFQWVYPRLKTAGGRFRIVILSVVFVVASVVATALLSSILEYMPEFVIAGLRIKDTDPDALYVQAYRGWLWISHISLWQQSPLTGIGTFDMMNIITDAPEGLVVGSGSESFYTGLLARVGAPAFLFAYALLKLTYRGCASRDSSIGTFAILLFVSMMTYGSFITPYSFLFYVLMSLLNGIEQPVAVRAKRKRSIWTRANRIARDEPMPSFDSKAQVLP